MEGRATSYDTQNDFCLVKVVEQTGFIGLIAMLLSLQKSKTDLTHNFFSPFFLCKEMRDLGRDGMRKKR